MEALGVLGGGEKSGEGVVIKLLVDGAGEEMRVVLGRMRGVCGLVLGEGRFPVVWERAVEGREVGGVESVVRERLAWGPGSF